MHFDFGFLLQVRSQFFERRVRLPLDLRCEQRQPLAIERGGVAAAMRLRREPAAGAGRLQQPADGTAGDAERLSYLIECAFAALVSEHDLLPQVSRVRPHGLMSGVSRSLNASAKRYRFAIFDCEAEGGPPGNRKSKIANRKF